MLAYYPGCSLSASCSEYGTSCEAVMKKLKIDYKEVPDWNCCGASAAESYDENLSLAVSYRNLVMAEKVSQSLVVPCSACFNHLKMADYQFNKSEEKREWLLKNTALKYSGNVKVEHFAELMLSGDVLEKIKKNTLVKLQGLKVAVYYGCMLMRPADVMCFDDPNNPERLDKFVADIGAVPVDWAYKTECCGAISSLANVDVVYDLTHKILLSAKNAGADCVLTVCPLCQSNLDLRQRGVEKKFGVTINMPILYISQLIGLGLGISPKELDLHKHSVDTMKLISKKKLVMENASA